MNYPHGLLQVGGFWAGIGIIPLAIGLLWYLVSHWGWWKLHRHDHRRPLIRTWHGWVESKDKEEKKTRNRLQKAPPRVIPRTKRTDYSWVFWDPTGEKQKKYEQEREETWVRYLPRWMRSSPFGSIEPDTNLGHDIQAGRRSETPDSDGASTMGYLGTLSLLGRQWRRGWRRAKRSTDTSGTYTNNDEHCPGKQSARASTAHQEPTNDSSATVRLRKTSRPSKLDWKANSEDVERATNNQLLAPTAGSNLANLFAREPVQRFEGSHRPGTSQASCGQGLAGCTTTSHRDPICRQHDAGRVRQPRNITIAGSSPPLPKSYLARRRIDNGIRAPYPSPQRVQTWTNGIENTRPPHQSVSASVVEHPDDDSVDGASVSDSTPTITVSRVRERRGAGGTDDSTAEAERMSMIRMPRMVGGDVDERENASDEDEGDF
ncbi:MAG: hypothetical protein LQ338_000504 [Usnochroma carphineum]|nr:MAG: hypothetical protein LQ338_000504 [Usnochroma carphineum]